MEKFFTGISAKIHIPVPKITDFLKSGTIVIDTIERCSKQRCQFIWSWNTARHSNRIDKMPADIKKVRWGFARTTLLLIDEPELYLHPQAIELVRYSLSTLSSEGYQVIFTTHSPCMITREEAVRTQIIRRFKGKTHALISTQAIIEQEFACAEAQSEMLFELGNASQVLFSEQILLFEGKTERAVFPELYHCHWQHFRVSESRNSHE